MSQKQILILVLLVLLVSGIAFFLSPFFPWKNREQEILALLGEKKWPQAESILEKSSIKEPKKTFLLARIRLGQGRPESALRVLDSLSPEAKNLFDFRVLAGRAFLAMGNAAGSLVLFDLAQQEKPTDPEAVRGLAGALYDLGALDRSYQVLTEFLSTQTDPIASRFAGQLAKELGKFDEATDHYAQALKGTWPPENETEIRWDLLEVLLERNDLPRAKALWEESNTKTPESTQKQLLGGRYFLLSGQWDQAETLLDQARIKDPTNGTIARLRGQVWLEKNQPGEAIPLLELAIRQDPLDAPAWNLLARAWQTKGNQEKAKEAREGLDTATANLKKMSELNQKANANPGDKDVRLELAKWCRKWNRPKLAEIWEKAAAQAGEVPRDSREKPGS